MRARLRTRAIFPITIGLIEGEDLEAYWVDIAQIQRSAAPSMLLGEISVAGIKHHKGVTVADCVGWLKRDLLERAEISDRQSDAKYRLDLAITHMILVVQRNDFGLANLAPDTPNFK